MTDDFEETDKEWMKGNQTPPYVKDGFNSWSEWKAFQDKLDILGITGFEREMILLFHRPAYHDQIVKFAQSLMKDEK